MEGKSSYKQWLYLDKIFLYENNLRFKKYSGPYLLSPLPVD